MVSVVCGQLVFFYTCTLKVPAGDFGQDLKHCTAVDLMYRKHHGLKYSAATLVCAAIDDDKKDKAPHSKTAADHKALVDAPPLQQLMLDHFRNVCHGGEFFSLPSGTFSELPRQTLESAVANKPQSRQSYPALQAPAPRLLLTDDGAAPSLNANATAGSGGGCSSTFTPSDIMVFRVVMLKASLMKRPLMDKDSIHSTDILIRLYDVLERSVEDGTRILRVVRTENPDMSALKLFTDAAIDGALADAILKDMMQWRLGRSFDIVCTPRGALAQLVNPELASLCAAVLVEVAQAGAYCGTSLHFDWSSLDECHTHAVSTLLNFSYVVCADEGGSDAGRFLSIVNRLANHIASHSF